MKHGVFSRRAGAVAWDIDGTLIDSEPLFREAMAAVSADYGIDFSTLPPALFIGVDLPGIWELISRMGARPAETGAWVRDVTDYYLDHVPELTPMPRARETVAAIAAMGTPQVAVSNSSRVIVEANLNRLEIGRYLRFSISLDEAGRGKPDPAPYLLAAEKLNLRPAQMLAVEDSVSGVESARAAGMAVIGCGPERAKLTKAHVVCNDLAMVAQYCRPAESEDETAPRPSPRR